ncbi:MAG: NAD(P)H-dependent oxidoreductase subunit E [Candidatus Zixiibacteriota bacterium]
MNAPRRPHYDIVDHPQPVAWSEEARREVDAILAKYPNKRSATLPILWLAVREFGWISPQVEEIVAAAVGEPVNHIHEVVTFYTMYPRGPLGRHEIQICRNVSCWLAGGDQLRDYLMQKLGVGLGETTQDGKFTLTEVECLCFCERAPAMRFDNRIEDQLTKEKIDRILADAS